VSVYRKLRSRATLRRRRRRRRTTRRRRRRRRIKPTHCRRTSSGFEPTAIEYNGTNGYTLYLAVCHEPLHGSHALA
jgi:hypothetical protein